MDKPFADIENSAYSCFEPNGMSQKPITQLLLELRNGGRETVDELLPLVYDELRRLAAGKKSDEFFATLFRLLQEQLGERLDRPATSITEAVLDEPEVTKRIPAELIAELRRFFSLCNRNRSGAGDWCSASMAASRSRCSCCSRASSAPSSRASSSVMTSA